VNYIERMLESAEADARQIKKIGIDAVAEKCGLTRRVVNKYCNDPLKSKNSDIKKIRDAIAELAPAEQPKKEGNE
jgi:hypothetical protein